MAESGPGEIDSNRLVAILGPAARLWRPKRCRVLSNAALWAAQFDLFGRKKIGTRLGPYSFWRARRDSNSRPPGS